MKRIHKILENQQYREHVMKIQAAEADRRFCRHNIAHFLDVARIAMIMNQKEQLGICDEWIYAAGLLHDVGRYVQYEDKTPHEQASAVIAPTILEECGFAEDEIQAIIDAILCHRSDKSAEEKNLRGLLYRADKASRACFACEASKDCNWEYHKRNQFIIY